jgi:glyoxylase-like metal-dependent hydrolase (beta-lactamase superfamily II)
MLQKKYHCKIAMHKDDSSMAENLVFLKRKTRTLSGKVFTLLRKISRKIKGMKFSFDKFTPDLFLHDGQRLDEFGFKATVIHIPGHTRGSIGLLTDDGALFAGDTFTNRSKPDVATYVENASELENSIRRLKTLPVKTVYPGHGKPFEMKQLFHTV